jgi:aldose 1-epimerase
MKIKKKSFGVLSSGEKVSLFTVSNGEMSFSVTNYGCAITSIKVPSAKGKVDDVVLGYSTLDGYVKNGPFLGCLVGRFANRISNAAFSIGGVTYKLTDNEGGNCLHGGKPGYHKMVWSAEAFSNTREAGVLFRRTSEDGEQGFPGTVDFRVSYSLTSENDIIIRYNAKTDAPTPINLTNHTYFNLAGHDSGNVLDHQVQLFCDRYVPVDSHAIPSGEILDVAGTPFDFRSPKAIGKDIDAVPGGYDHNWEINRAGDGPSPVAGVFDPSSGRALTVYSTQPGVQFYTGNFLNNEVGKNGELYGKNAGFCLETQHFPDSPNRREFPDCILLPGDQYRQQTIWHFDFEQ